VGRKINGEELAQAEMPFIVALQNTNILNFKENFIKSFVLNNKAPSGKNRRGL